PPAEGAMAARGTGPVRARAGPVGDGTDADRAGRDRPRARRDRVPQVVVRPGRARTGDRTAAGVDQPRAPPAPPSRPPPPAARRVAVAAVGAPRVQGRSLLVAPAHAATHARRGRPAVPAALCVVERLAADDARPARAELGARPRSADAWPDRALRRVDAAPRV